MPGAWYERLSILDYSFLAFEGPTTTMHIAATAVFETGPLATRNGGVDIECIRRHVASRLPLIPRYRQRLAYIPFENHPVWIDDDEFELRYHVRHTSVPRPGTDAQLQEISARLLERPLNRLKPLWEIWAIEGLERGRFALLMKVHHCMVDGLAGVELLSALLAPTPDTHIDEPGEWHPRPAPSQRRLLNDEVSRRVKMSVDLVRGLREAVLGPRQEQVALGRKLAAAWRLIRDGTRRPVATPLNQRIGPYRRFHWVTQDLGEIKQIKNQLGGTVNDVVLSMVAGAVREFFAHRHFTVNDVDFRVAVPVNVRPESERKSAGNYVSAWIVPLPLREAHAGRRLAEVQRLSADLKKTNQAGGAQLLTRAAEWTSANVLTLGAVVANQTQPFNLIVTNVPGPQIPLYLAGAPMVAVYPQVPLFEGQCLGVALFSYAGTLFWGFNADLDSLPDLERFVHAIERSFRALRKLARTQAPQQQRVTTVPRRARRKPRANAPTEPRFTARLAGSMG